jgi:hypothetical protein
LVFSGVDFVRRAVDRVQKNDVRSWTTGDRRKKRREKRTVQSETQTPLANENERGKQQKRLKDRPCCKLVPEAAESEDAKRRKR